MEPIWDLSCRGPHGCIIRPVGNLNAEELGEAPLAGSLVPAGPLRTSAPLADGSEARLGVRLQG
jgi:hypothetical protein